MLVSLYKNTNITINNKHSDVIQPSRPSNQGFSEINPISIPSFTNHRAYSVITFRQLPKVELEEAVKRISGKEFQGLELFDKEFRNFVVWKKVGWENLKQEPINWKTASKDDIVAFWHALALAEVKDNPWVRRYNYLNVPTPLATHHTASGITAKRASRDSLEALKAIEIIKDVTTEDKKDEAILKYNYQHAKLQGLSFADDYKTEERKRLEELSAVKKANLNKNLDQIVIDPQTDHLNFNFTVFDTETTGIQLFPTKRPVLLKGTPEDINIPADVIIQTGSVKFSKEKGLLPESAVSQLINPQRPIPEQATAVHGITDTMIEEAKKKGKAPTIDTILSPFIKDYIKDDVLVAFNSKFDITLLNNAIEKTQKTDLQKKALCMTLDPFILIQRIHPFVGAKKKLGEQYKWMFGQDLEGAHDAYADVKGTVDLLKYCIYYLQSKSRKPLTVRDILKFQHGGIVEGLGINLDSYTGCDEAKNFKTSYRGVQISAKGLPLGYSITDDPECNTLAKLTDSLIGKENFAAILGAKKEILINRPTPYTTEQKYREVLSTYVKATETQLQDEIIDIIVKHSSITEDVSKNLWMKNLNLHDIPEGNDLPDTEIAKKVMLERLEENQKFKDAKTKDFKTAIKLLNA